MSDAGPYIEAPTGRIVNCHFKKPNPTNLHPCGTLPQARAFKYGWGGIIAPVFDGTGTIISSVPYGPDQFPPMLGTWNTQAFNGTDTGRDYGGLVHPYINCDGSLAADTLTTPGWGQHANNLFLNATAFNFSNAFLDFLENPCPPPSVGWESWSVPGQFGFDCFAVHPFKLDSNGNTALDQGGNPIFDTTKVSFYQALPRVVKSWTMTVEWLSQAYHDLPDIEGIAISRPLTAGGPIPVPTEPLVTCPRLGVGASMTFTYDFNFAAWNAGVLDHSYLVDETNCFDPTIGGPVFLWWMEKPYPLNTWSADSTFAGGTNRIQITEGDWYTWELTAETESYPAPPGWQLVDTSTLALD